MKCKEMGLETHVFSWAEGAVCREHADYFYPISIVEKDAILSKCREIGIDGVVSIASDVAVITVNYIAHKLGLIANPIQYTDITTNKYDMRQALSTANVPCPGFIKVREREIPNVSQLKYPLIVKPTDRSGSRGVMKITDNSQLLTSIRRAKNESFKNEVIIEEFIDGKEISVESISFHGEHHILQITDKVTTGAPYFVELAHHQPSLLPSEIQYKVKGVVINALNALYIENGACHSELKITEKGEVYVIEIGARMGGDFIGSDLVRLSTGYDFVKGVVEVALGKFERPKMSESSCSGVYFLSLETKQLMKYIDNKECYPWIVQAKITDPELREIHESADRSGYFIYKSDHRLEC